MAGPVRPTAPMAGRKQSSMRPPSTKLQGSRPTSSTSAQQQRSGASSPADSLISSLSSPRRRATTTGIKRKERDYDPDGGEETNINVVVRCRGRNEREVRENSGVVVSTDAVRGSNVELSMGPSALSNKTYHFDKVFAPAADQSMIFDDVVTPVLDEMLQGFNCTIFAYGQTGTGKTYTMTGDMSEAGGLLSESAGIIPRVLHALFRKLEMDENETSVKCSFIELYNEELRDLLSLDDTTKLKIYEDTQKKGQTATLVQGMEEAYIKSAKDGISLLQSGSHKRQVAATKCNDLSSRSHSVFTVTAYMKKSTESGEDIVCAGKLNLVDLAGSENIQRSGAENKRAAEAGLINKSLLTLGRVINSLVERSSHIPYRESKLTRLLQDSLGGRTKTCIIATISPAKSNLEETISTLDYAFRAKNIKNKPQINQMISKKTMLREFTSEIEKLKMELQATRQRNGVYLTAEGYDEIVGASESRRILSEEQAQKIETMEVSLRTKVQELFTLTNSFNAQRKDSELTRQELSTTKDLLEQTDEILAQTKQSLEEETTVRRAHQMTEKRLQLLGGELLDTVTTTKRDVNSLHAKVDRKQKLLRSNALLSRTNQHDVEEITESVESHLGTFQMRHDELLHGLSSRLQKRVEVELEMLQQQQNTSSAHQASVDMSSATINQERTEAMSEMNGVLEGIKVLREEVKQEVGVGLQGLSSAAARISGEVINELGTFQNELQSSYSSLGRDFKALFDRLVQDLTEQKQEAERLRIEMSRAAHVAAEAQQTTAERLEDCFREEKEQADAERDSLQRQIADLISQTGARQESRWRTSINAVKAEMRGTKESIQTAETTFVAGMSAWSCKEEDLVHEMVQSREKLKTRMRDDWKAAQDRNQGIKTATKSVHEETVHIVDVQVADMARRMQALDEFVSRARHQNERSHQGQAERFEAFTAMIRQAHHESDRNTTKTVHSLDDLKNEADSQMQRIRDQLPELQEQADRLVKLRKDVQARPFEEYVATGSTPPRTIYQHPQTLPQTEPREQLLQTTTVPTKPHIYVDPSEECASPSSRTSETSSLREVSSNVHASLNRSSMEALEDMGPPPFKRQAIESKLPTKLAVHRGGPVRLEGRENAGAGRRLRSSLSARSF